MRNSFLPADVLFDISTYAKFKQFYREVIFEIAPGSGMTLFSIS